MPSLIQEKFGSTTPFKLIPDIDLDKAKKKATLETEPEEVKNAFAALVADEFPSQSVTKRQGRADINLVDEDKIPTMGDYHLEDDLAFNIPIKASKNDEADPLPDITEYEDNDPIDCEWKEWGECSGTCGEGIEVLNFPAFFKIPICIFFQFVF